MNIRIPTSVRVGGHVFTVEMVETNDTAKGAENYDNTDFNLLRILIDRDIAQGSR
jgi:hypothetical protein